MTRFWLMGMLLLWMALGWSNSISWAWDGDWTQAKSGKGDIFDDPDSSQGKAGTDPPQKFLTPNPRDYVDVDPEELDDYFHRYNKNYTPYALARVTQDMHYNNLVIPKGYYLVKPGNINDGSPRVNLPAINAAGNATGPVTPGQLPPISPTDPGAPTASTQSTPTINPDKSVYQVFVLKRQGKVMGVVPINRMENYTPPRHQKVPRQALAWIEMEDRHPVLKFYYKKRLYCTDFQ